LNSLVEAYELSLNACLAVIPSEPYSFSLKNNDGVLKHYEISPAEFERALTNKLPRFAAFSPIFAEHLLGQKNIIAAFASTPVSFSDAWNMKATELTAQDVTALTKSGGHFQFNQLANGQENQALVYIKQGMRRD